MCASDSPERCEPGNADRALSGPGPKVALSSALHLALAVGIGRFAYTPILPLMQDDLHLAPWIGSALATANYSGYLVGAIAGMHPSQKLRTRRSLLLMTTLLVATLVAMPWTSHVWLWSALRVLAGVASALIFVVSAERLLAHARVDGNAAWSFGGVGVGIALSGAVILTWDSTVGPLGWQAAWWLTALLATCVGFAADRLWSPPGETALALKSQERTVLHRADRTAFRLIWIAYTLEGVGYIIAGTFLVAAIEQQDPGGLGSAAWTIVGLAAAPSCAMWVAANRVIGLPLVLTIAFVVQCLGVSLPLLIPGVATTLVAAMLFGMTMIAIPWMSIAIGIRIGITGAVAALTAGYGLGQVLGPLLVAPLLNDGYSRALGVAAGVLVAGGCAAASLAALRHPRLIQTAPSDRPPGPR